MEKCYDFSSIQAKFDEKMENFNIEGQELSSINTAMRALKDKNVSLLIRRNENAFENLIHDHIWGDVTSNERKSQDANELSGTVSTLDGEFNDITDIKSALISREYTISDNKAMVDDIVGKVNDILNKIEVSRDKGKDVLDGNVEKYITGKAEVQELTVEDKVEEEPKAVEETKDEVVLFPEVEEYTLEENHEDDVVPFFTVEEEKAEKVEDVEETNKSDFQFEEINLDELNKSLEESLKEDEEFHNQEIVTDSIEEDNKEEIQTPEVKEEDKIDKLTELFKDDELDKELEKFTKTKEDLQETKKELDNLVQFPSAQEDKLPVVEDDFKLGEVHNDYREVPAGFVKVVGIESTDSLQQAESEENKYSRAM